MNTSTLALRSAIAFLFSACLLAGCGGTKVLKEPQPIQTTKALAVASDRQIGATLDWVIVRDGPGTWAKNADWDEYLLRVNNQSDRSILVTRLLVVDSLGTRIESQPGRKQLVKSSKKTAKRYKKSGVKVKAGMGVGGLLASGAAVTVAGVGIGMATMGPVLGGATAGAGAGVAVGGLLLLGPALAVGGVVRGVRNSAVNKQIELRQTVLPLEIPASSELGLGVFFPLAPSPKTVELVYTDATGEHSLVIDTSTALDGLHIDAPQD
ncbi:MAG: hypothetical protein OEM20_05875 [Gammaproteobacteria bacterium]|nr:hypothetical protein [Gammaproteobacteria bacterium]MDH3577351.1 hypothetical protein [Gammaproteobacteria bacterium]